MPTWATPCAARAPFLAAPFVAAPFVAAQVTLVVAVAADLLARAHPGHVVATACLALVVGTLRVALAGRWRELFGALSGALVAQPVLHAVAALLHPAHGSPTHESWTDAAVIAIQMAGTALVVLGVTSTEAATEAAVQLAPELGRRARAALVLLVGLLAGLGRATRQRTLLPSDTTRVRRPGRRWWDHQARRGPPAVLAAL